MDALERGSYKFGGIEIDYPDDGERSILVEACTRCGLIYKDQVPERGALSEILSTHAESVWTSHDYTFEIVRAAVVSKLGQPECIDVLDVGSSDGGMLKTFDGIAGRRSGLDVVPNPSCERVIRGEYIAGFVEEDVPWSGEPYDAVIVCDVLEHLYNPYAAFENLAEFTRPDGILFAQTGDADAPQEAGSEGLGTWWYLNLFEHHIAWTAPALRWVAERTGLSIEALDRTLHKDRQLLPTWKRWAGKALSTARNLPRTSDVLSALTGRDPRLTPDPYARDHLTAVLRRRP